VVHIRDEEGVGVAYKLNLPKNQSPDDDGEHYVKSSFQIDPKSLQQVATEF